MRRALVTAASAAASRAGALATGACPPPRPSSCAPWLCSALLPPSTAATCTASLAPRRSVRAISGATGNSGSSSSGASPLPPAAAAASAGPSGASPPPAPPSEQPVATRRRRSKAAAPAAAGAAPPLKGRGQRGAAGAAGEGAAALAAEVEALRATLERHRDLYFNGTPEIDDAAYDSLKSLYVTKAAALQDVAAPAVTVPVGAPPRPGSGLRKTRHVAPMLSLASVTSRAEVEAWLARTLARVAASAAPMQPKASYTWVVEPKIDGLAVRVKYVRTADGTYALAEAATRGDGQEGEDVTHNALGAGIAGLPRVLRPTRPPAAAAAAAAAAAGSGGVTAAGATAAEGSGDGDAAGGPEWVEVRGEVYVRGEDLQAVNAELTAAGQQPFANARNSAAGGLRLLSASECRRRRLSFTGYGAVAPLPYAGGAGASGGGDGVDVRPLHGSHWETLAWLQAAGCATSPDNVRCGSAEEAVAAAEAWMGRRATLGYDADGVVLKLDDTTAYDTLGATASDPRWALAWKFPAGQAVARLQGVEWSVARQGQVTPVALLEPVALGGVTIRRATLHNAGAFEGLGLWSGDAVVVARSGDVIPQVLRALPELRLPAAAPLLPPTACPACGSALRRQAAVGRGAGDQLVCDSAHCSAKAVRTLLHFASVCLRHSGLGDRTVPVLEAAGAVRSIPDFYRLDEAALSALPGGGPTKAAKALAVLHASRAMPSSLLLRALSIRGVGDSASLALGAAFPLLGELLELAAAAREGGVDGAAAVVAARSGVGQAIARSVVQWFAQPANRQLLAELADVGVACIKKRPPAGAAAPAAAASSAATAPHAAPSAAAAKGGRSKARGGKAGGGGAEPSDAAGGGGGGGAAATAAAGPRLKGVAGLRVCFTGTMQALKREEMKALLTACGGEPHDSVKTTTDLLVVGGDAGQRKREDAARKGVRVVEEADFWRAYGSG